MSATLLQPNVLVKMKDAGVPIRLAVKFHSFMRKQKDSRKVRKAVRTVLSNIRKNFNGKH